MNCDKSGKEIIDGLNENQDGKSNINNVKNKKIGKKKLIIFIIAVIFIIGAITSINIFISKSFENKYIAQTKTIASNYKLEDASIEFQYISKVNGIKRYDMTLESSDYENLQKYEQYDFLKEIEEVDKKGTVILIAIVSNKNKYQIDVVHDNVLIKNNKEYYNTTGIQDDSSAVSNATTSNAYEPSDDDKGFAIAVAKQEVKNRLKSPSSAKFPWGYEEYNITKSSGNNYTVSSYVDAENSFGAELRTYYTVEFTKTGEETYIVSNVYIAE